MFKRETFWEGKDKRPWGHISLPLCILATSSCSSWIAWYWCYVYTNQSLEKNCCVVFWFSFLSCVSLLLLIYEFCSVEKVQSDRRNKYYINTIIYAMNPELIFCHLRPKMLHGIYLVVLFSALPKAVTHWRRDPYEPPFPRLSQCSGGCGRSASREWVPPVPSPNMDSPLGSHYHLHHPWK